MSAPTDQDRSAARLAGARGAAALGRLWQGAGLLYLVTCLAGMAIGLWPHATFPSTQDVPTAPLPTLAALGVAQVAFILLIYPMVIWVRADRGGISRYWPLALAESALCTVAAVPFYLAAGFLADAGVADVVRTAVCVACVWPVAWAAGAWLVSARPRPGVVTLGLLGIAIGLPAACYIVADFFGATEAARRLSHFAPAMFVYQAAGGRSSSAVPEPLWGAICWPVIAAVAALALLVWPQTRR